MKEFQLKVEMYESGILAHISCDCKALFVALRKEIDRLCWNTKFFSILKWTKKPTEYYIETDALIYRMSQEECARLREGLPYVKVYRYNPKHLCPKLNGYGDNGQRKVWSSCGSTYCTWLAWRNTHTLRIVRPCLQPAHARSLLRLHM